MVEEIGGEESSLEEVEEVVEVEEEEGRGTGGVEEQVLIILFSC